MSAALSKPLPARKVEYTRPEPAGFILLTKTSPLPGGPCNGFTTGKSAESVLPVIYAFPTPSAAIPIPASLLDPPRYVEYPNAVPSPLIFATNASDRGQGCVGAPGGQDVGRITPAVTGKF